VRDLATIEREQARYLVLRMLKDQPDGRLNIGLMHRHLKDVFGFSRPIEWLRDQLSWLEQVDAVILRDAGILFAELTARGEQHLERESLIPGVEPPPRPGA
jgi:hypothetical protein